MRLTSSGSRVTARVATELFRYLLVAIMASLMEEVDRCGGSAELTWLRPEPVRLVFTEMYRFARQSVMYRSCLNFCIQLLFSDGEYSH